MSHLCLRFPWRMFWKLYLEAAESVNRIYTVVLSSHDWSLISESDRVPSPVLLQQLSHQPPRLLFNVQVYLPQCREALCNFLTQTSRPGGVSRPRLCTLRFRKDAGGFEMLFWLNACTALILYCCSKSILLARLKVREKELIVSLLDSGLPTFSFKMKCRWKLHRNLFRT